MTGFLSPPGSGASASKFASRWAPRRTPKNGQQKKPNMGKFLSIAAGLSFLVTSNSLGTVWPSDGSEANVQAIHDTNAQDGDTITLPAGTFIWITGVTLTKGITLRGQTTITGAGTATCTSDDQTVVIDGKSHVGAGKVLNVTIPAGQAFRLTGITFRKGTVTTYGGDGAIQIDSTGFVNNARVDNCRFDHLYWNAAIEIRGWVIGVQDHCLVESNSQGF